MRNQLPSLSLRIDSGCGSFRQPLSDLFLFHATRFKFSINGRTCSSLMRHNRKIWTRKEGTPSQIRWYIANLSSGTKSISQTPCTQVLDRPNSVHRIVINRNGQLQHISTVLSLRHPTKFSNVSVPIRSNLPRAVESVHNEPVVRR